MKKLALAAALAAVSTASYAVSPTACLSGDCENACTGNGGNPTGSVPAALVIDKVLRDEMQIQSFGAASACVGNTSVLCMPGISSAEMASLFAGDVANWGQAISGNVGNVGGNDIVARCGLGGDTAESQAMLNQLEGLAAAATAEDAVGSFDTCMDVVPGKKGGANTRKIGVSGYNQDTSAAAYDFIKLDGAAATASAHASANYNLVVNVCDGSGISTALGAPIKHSSGANAVTLPARPFNGGIIFPDTPL